jgi:hypothetical protein
MLNATLTAAHRLCANASFGVSVKKIEPHTTGQNGHRLPAPCGEGSHRDAVEGRAALGILMRRAQLDDGIPAWKNELSLQGKTGYE